MERLEHVGLGYKVIPVQLAMGEGGGGCINSIILRSPPYQCLPSLYHSGNHIMRERTRSCRIHVTYRYLLTIIRLAVESQKGINDLQRCSVENQKGAIAIQSI